MTSHVYTRAFSDSDSKIQNTLSFAEFNSQTYQSHIWLILQLGEK